MELEQDNKPTGYKKIRYFLIVENILIVLAFLLFAVGFYYVFSFASLTWFAAAYFSMGAAFFLFGITIALKMVKAFQRDDLPVYSNMIESDDVDPETGLPYFDSFTRTAETQLTLSMSDVYLASFEIEGLEHLRHFVGYQKAADTMAEIGNIFKMYQKRMGERYVTLGCKSGHEFVVMTNEVESRDIQNYLLDIMNGINEIVLRLPTTENFSVYCGYCSSLQGKHIEDMIQFTNFAVMEAAMFKKSEPHYFSADAFRRQESEYIKDDKIRKILDGNELQYNFQPIVSAKTGKIFAYEALMRTNKEIGFSPTDVLELAERQDRLYEVEHYTFFNVIKIMSENAKIFENRKLFINSIPTVIIKENEFNELHNMYKEVMKNLVIEITENGMQSEDSCETVHKYMKKSGCELALDDYGTGYSNASTLLNNSPHYIKIDHSIIMGIDTDSRKQQIVSNTVSFGNNHGMKILAEGVETPDELQMVIQLGCHLIQGFYTGRPGKVIAETISADVEEEIMAINLKLAKLALENKSYTPGNFETISLINLALDFYSQIIVEQPSVNLVGMKTKKEVNMCIKVPDNIETVINLKDVNIRGRDNAVIEIGENSFVTLALEGNNIFSYEGIKVPATSRLNITGKGNLTIRVDHNNGIGIGSGSDEKIPYGDICFEGTGTLRIEANSDQAFAIGGFLSDENSRIKIDSGNVEIIVNGSKTVGIGSMKGFTHITVNQSHVAISSSGADAIGIGSMEGKVDINISADVELDASGSRATGIGVLQYGKGNVNVISGFVSCNVHSMSGMGIGSLDGDMDIRSSAEQIFIYVEGSEVGGIGTYHGYGVTRIMNGVHKVVLLAANPVSMGGTKGKLEITGGNIFADLSNSTDPVNQFNVPVFKKVITDTELYSKKIETEEGSYQYMASQSKLFENIYIYIPKFCNELDANAI
ncbi:MAG: EAL domain-containing protein [Lachnospiraceae bacterium]|nr:EAL domain-containing protein [Lachnospiraceae bacterium]